MNDLVGYRRRNAHEFDLSRESDGQFALELTLATPLLAVSRSVAGDLGHPVCLAGVRTSSGSHSSSRQACGMEGSGPSHARRAAIVTINSLITANRPAGIVSTIAHEKQRGDDLDRTTSCVSRRLPLGMIINRRNLAFRRLTMRRAFPDQVWAASSEAVACQGSCHEQAYPLVFGDCHTDAFWNR
jgi:hypothetical protein